MLDGVRRTVVNGPDPNHLITICGCQLLDDIVHSVVRRSTDHDSLALLLDLLDDRLDGGSLASSRRSLHQHDRALGLPPNFS